MSKCCTEACTKSRVVFTLGLLECLFFSGFLTGWGYISNILEKDGYFASSNCLRPHDCLNMTNSGEEGEETVAGTLYMQLEKDIERNTSVQARHADVGPSPYNDPTAVDSQQPNTGSDPLQQPPQTAQRPGYQNLRGDCIGHNVSGSGLPEGNSSAGAHALSLPPASANEECLAKQRELLQYVYMVALLLTGLLAAPLGLFYDTYGTLKSRILTIFLFTTTTLLITFSSNEQAWLLFVAMPTAGLCGVLLLLTNLQVANLLHHRVTALLLYHAAQDGAAAIMMLVQLSSQAGLNLQSSFMFLTVGVVPMLICTIAFLPKRQIPWPLPDNYKEMKDSIRAYVHKNCQAQMRKKASSHRRIFRLSVATGGHSCLYLAHIMWSSLILLRLRAVEFRHQSWCNTSGDVTSTCVSPEPSCIYNATYPCAALLILLLGLALDRRLKEQTESEDQRQRMIIRCHAVIFLLITFLNIILSVFLVTSRPWTSYVISVIHILLRIIVPGISASFIFTVLPCRHFGQNYGTMLALIALSQAIILFPIHIILDHRDYDLVVNIGCLCLSVVCLVFPLYLLLNKSSIEFNVKAKEQDIMLCPAGSMCKTDRGRKRSLTQEECQTMVESVF